MTPLEFSDLFWEVAMLGPQVVPGRGNLICEVSHREKGGPERLEELPRAT